jgi:hypothetical protein
MATCFRSNIRLFNLAKNLSLKPEIFNGSWNFGPDEKDPISVQEIIEIVKTNGELFNIKIENDISDKESKYLQLDITKSKVILNGHQNGMLKCY